MQNVQPDGFCVSNTPAVLNVSSRQVFCCFGSALYHRPQFGRDTPHWVYRVPVFSCSCVSPGNVHKSVVKGRCFGKVILCLCNHWQSALLYVWLCIMKVQRTRQKSVLFIYDLFLMCVCLCVCVCVTCCLCTINYSSKTETKEKWLPKRTSVWAALVKEKPIAVALIKAFDYSPGFLLGTVAKCTYCLINWNAKEITIMWQVLCLTRDTVALIYQAMLNTMLSLGNCSKKI